MFLPENLHIAYLEVLETYENALLRGKKRKKEKEGVWKFQTKMPFTID